jgi:hypothetical protein
MRFATFSESTALARAGVVSDAGIHPLPPEVTVMVDRLLRERGRYGVGDDRAGVPAAHGQVIYANGGVA